MDSTLQQLRVVCAATARLFSLVIRLIVVYIVYCILY